MESPLLDDDEDNFPSSQESVHFEQGLSNQEDLNSKVFNDPIHGHIELHPLLVKIIDTPQFQRLRNIKQLGANYFVYPGASHHRFEHCIGTCHLAGKLARHLQSRQQELNITKEDVVCVEIAALVHDLGHGPFSHMFDMEFMPRMRPGEKHNHEEMSCKMLDHLIEVNDLKKYFEQYNLDDTDIKFVKEMIAGPRRKLSNGIEDASRWLYEGRPRSKAFLYEIVSNDRNKVDVDKWDYFARDCHHLGIKNSFNHERYIHFCRVLTVEGENPQICARDKEGFNLYEMFHTRSKLHRNAYQHTVSTKIELMICDAMALADKHLQYKGENGKMFCLSRAVDDCYAFTTLTDSVFYDILNSHSDHEDMMKARNILQCILKRKLYCFVGITKPPYEEQIKLDSECRMKIKDEIADLHSDLSPCDIVVFVKNYNYGMKDKNPCDKMRFYSKERPNKPYLIRKEDVSEMLPGKFQDFEVHVYCKVTEKKEITKQAFVLWCKQKNFRLPKALNDSDGLTPMKRKDSQSHSAIKVPRLEI